MNYLKGTLKPYKTLLLLCIVSTFTVSCTTPAIQIQDNTVYEGTVPLSPDQYLIGAGDAIEATYYFTMSETQDEYRIAVGDAVRIEVYLHPELGREEAVLPDGLISLPPKGKLKAAGMTRTDLEKKITDLYTDLIIDPVVTVTLTKYNYALNQLRDAISATTRGQVRTFGVRPDGYISFPGIKELQVAGMTLGQISSTVNQLYQEKYNKNLQLFLSLTEARNNVAYVMGEVGAPNFYPIDRRTTLSQILARAGISMSTAELSTIVIISRTDRNQPLARVINFDEIIRSGNIGKDIVLKQYDVVFVPRTKIREVSQFVTQLNDSIPFFRGVGLGFSYLLNPFVRD